MKNLLNNLLNWVLKKGSSETKKEQAWEEKEQAGSKKDQVKGTKLVQKRTKLSEKEQAGSKKEQAEQKGNKLGEKGTSLEMNPCVMGSEVMSVKGSEAVSANHALITQLSRNNHPISLRAIRYAAMIFMVLMVGVGQVWSADQVLKTVDFSTSAWSSATFTANATTVVDDVTASSSSSSSKPTISISSGKFTMSSNMSSGKNCVGFQVSGIQYGTLIIEVYSDASTITRCNYTVKDGGSSFSTSDAGSGTSSTAGEPIIVTGLTKTSAYVYVGRQGSSYTQFSKIIVKTPNPTGKTYAESTFYTTYASSSKTNAQLISSASFPENFLPIFDGASALNEKPASTPTVTTPYDFSGVSTSSKSYILQTANNNVLLLNNVANVKSVRFYGDGNGSSGNISVNVTKQSGSGSTFSVSNISFTSTYTILEHSTGDLTGKSGYDANTFYNYKFTFSKKFHIWGVYVEAIVAEKDYTVTAATSTGDNTYGTVSAAASSLDEDETTTITATPATGYKVTNWAVSDGDNGASISPNGASNSETTTLTMGTANATVTATFGPKSYTVTLNTQSATTPGTENVTTTYNSNTNLTSTITKPTKTGYVFAGYFTGTNGTGIQLIDPAGNWIASAGGGSTYTDGSKNWKYDNNLTLYACWMNYANSLDLQTYVETVVGSSAGDKKTSTDYSILSSNNYFYLLNTASSSTCLDNSDNAAYRGLKFKRSGDYVLFLVPANYSLSVKFGYVKTTKPKYSINGGAESSFSTISLASDNQSVDMGSETYDRLVKIKAADDDAAVLKTVTITASCTAPNHVDISGTWHLWAGGSMTLSATAYSSEGTGSPIDEEDIYSYQWYKGGTEEGNKIVGATSKTYTKSGCDFNDAGYYYCKVNTGADCGTMSGNYAVRMLRIYVKTGKESGGDYGTIDCIDLNNGNYEAQGTIRLASGGYTYGFGISDGCNNWSYNSGTMTSSSCTDWDMDKSGGTSSCGLTSTNFGIYTFTLKYGNLYDSGTYGGYYKVSVNYPTTDQAAGKIIYFDNSTVNWSNLHWRIGQTGNTVASAMSLVPGTANLYKVSTSYYGSLTAWHIANQAGWTGSSNSIYKTKTGDGYAITKAIEFDGGAVTDAAITIIPKTTPDPYKGGDDQNNNCDFHYYDYKKFLWTHTATISATTNGSIQLNWTDINNAAQSATSTTSGLAHTCNLQITGVPDAGYDVATLTVNGSNFTSGNTHVLSADATIAATFSPQVYTINYYDLGGGAFSGSHADGHPTSHTYNTATTLKGATLSNYTWDGWYTASDCASGKVTSLGATAYTASPNLYAKFTQSITLDREGASSGSTSVTATYKSATLPSITNPSKTGYTFGGWYTGDDGTGNLVINTSGALQESVSGYTGTGGIWTSSSARTLHAKWTAKQTTITINANTDNNGSTAPSPITATYGSALPSFTAATGASGYSLTGYYTDATSGTKVINADGTLVASTDYADGDGKWNSEVATLTLYAQYEEEGGGGDCVYSVIAAAVLSGTTSTSTLTGGTLLAEGLDGSGPYKLNSKPSYFGMKLSNNLQVGDSIIFKVKVGDWWQGKSADNVPIVVFAGKSLGKEIYRTSAIAKTTDNYYVRFIVTQDMISSYGLTDTVIIWRSEANTSGCSDCCTQNHQMYSMQVKHCTPSCSTPSAPTSPTNGATTSNTQAVSWTDASNDAWEVYVNTSSSTPDAGQSPTAEPTSTSYTFTGLTASTEYHWWVRSVCDASHKSAWVAGTSFTTTAAAASYTVTYNAQGGSVTPSSETVSTATLPTPTKSGYTFDGWYTSGGSKITGTYNPTADITLYAQWRENCVGTATTLVDIDFKDAAWSDKTFSQGNTNDEDEINGVYFWAKDATKHFSLEDNTSNGLTFPNNNMSSGTYYFCIPITGINSSITVTLKHGYSSAQAEYKWAYVDGRTSFSDGNTGGSGGTKVQDASKASTEMTFTKGSLSNASGHLFIGRSSSSYTNIYGVTVTTPGAAGTCYYVTYNGNGATGGYTTDEAAYASGDNATAATNSFTKTGYTFGGWATSKANADAEIKAYDEGDAISITGNITLYAIWQAAGYTLAWNTNGGSALSGTYSSGSFADGATITAPNDPTRANYTFDSWNTAGDGTGNAYTGTMPAASTTYYAVWKNTLTLKTGSQGSESDKSPTVFLDGSSLNGFSAHKAAGYTLQGYYTAATGGTKVLNADGSFAASNIARFVTSGKWSRTTGDTILVAQWESSYLLKWNLQLNKAEDAISTTSKESATARVTTASMTNLTNNGELTITSSKKSDLTSKIETPINLSGAESKYMSVSFDVTAGYQLLPSAVKVMVQPVGDGENKYAKLILEDENSHSINTVVECEGTEKGKKTTVTLSNAGGTVFTGTVTLKILVYNASAASTTNNCYRLGSPIQIDGAIEAACDLPSYEGLEYDQTEYTVGVDEASAIRVTGGSANTYEWKWNSTNDRSTGTKVGTNDASYTPTISEVGTRYYWCELTNDDCEGVVKTPAVAITVRANKSDASVTWTDPANEPNYGGGGYVIRATMNSGYDGELSAEDLTAPAGIRITNVSIDNEAAQKYIEATFDVTTAFDRDENSVIAFTLSHDATTGYDAISDEHKVDYDACSGGEEGSAAIALTSAIHDEGSGNAPRYWFETIGVGRVFGLNYGKATLGTSSDATFSTEGYSYVASSTSQRWVFQPYVEGVTKIRIYIKSATNTLRILSIGKNASWQDQSSKYSNIAVDTIIYSNGKTTGLDNNQKGYAEIQFSSALTKDNYYMFTMSSSSTYIYGVTLYSGSVGDGGNLATSLTFANTGPIDANASTANFQNIASKSGENSNTLGTITYSSNNDAATVNTTTGEVSIHAKETAQVVTITATLSASGCYQGATATYTINVAADLCDEPSGSIELTGSATKCSDESVTLTMTGFTSGATVEWYNGDTKVNGTSGYTIVTSGSTSTLETSNAGTYSAIAKVDGGCPSGAGRTNSITISNISVDASATKIVDKWYVKNGRLTPDIALWQLSEGATLDEVTIERNVSGEGTLGLTSSDFVARDGIVYLSGKEPSANKTGADIEYTLTLTVKDACDAPHEMTEKTITLTHQKNTDKHVLAFVVNGTAKGGFTEGMTAAQTTGVSLYNTIAAQFDVQTTNIYSTDDEQKLREYYSQYDILCITDYPNTQTKGVNSKSYVDAIGALIDIRPILTMEAFVSKLANWKAKGISGNPKSPTTRQYTMDLQCKDHEIFAGTKLTKVGEGEDEMYRVSMVDNTLEDYATLDATYGAILPHKEKESKSGAGDGEYNYGGKPALQGFTFTQEMIDNDLLPIGLIDDGAGNPLQVGIERQHNMEARLMVLGINSYAMERLTDDGERVVINALNYLMKKNQEDIADCSTAFVGGAEGDETNWNNADNWTGNTVPLPTQKVRILADCEVSSTVYAQSVLIVTDGKYNHGSDDAAGKLTIKENGALIVGGKIQAASAPAYNRPRATTPDKLIINTDDSGQAALIFDNEEAETQATVHLYSLGRKPSSYQYQYFAVPMEVVPVNPTFANETHGGTGIYTYVYEEASSGWTRRKYYDDLFAFEGLGITTKSTGAMNYTMTGNLASTATKEITLTHDGAGLNLVGNSWMAPIQIGALAEDNAGLDNQTAYIYCAGRDAVEGAATSGDTETAGQWIAIPFEAAEFATWKAAGKLSVIPAMQAFQIKVDAEATLTLDYDKVVRGSTNDLNAKLRAPGRRMAANEVTMTNIRVADSKTHTDLSLFEGDRFSEAFDNGWEAEYMNGDGRSAKLYAETEAGQMAVVAMYDYEGTVVGFAPGQETEYTFSFMGEDNGYYLNDIKLQNSVRISEGETYTFTYEEGDAANRFYISRTAINAPEVATGMENLDAAAPRVQKIIYNDKLYIIRGGRLYDATGKVVK